MTPYLMPTALLKDELYNDPRSGVRQVDATFEQAVRKT